MEGVEHAKESGYYHDVLDIPLPIGKLSCTSTKDEKKIQAVLVETGSFNPPTYMHLRMFELGREALISRGYHFAGGYMSPVNNAYGKQGLVHAEHRIKMCQLAVEGSSFIMVDPWEALQPTYQRTLKVLARVADALHNVESINTGVMRVLLLCGADLLESFTVPGVWLPDQVETICRDYGLVCIRRGELDLTKLILESDPLSKYKENIIIVNDFESDISSTRVRENLSKGLALEHLTPPRVIDYIKSKNLYTTNA